MKNTPASLRHHIGLVGRRNVGKSSLLNAFTDQTVAIVSDRPGTTTDPVKKPMELQPIGPVMFVDTAGLDDEGALGDLRSNRTRRVLDRLDLALLVVVGDAFGDFENDLLEALRGREISVIVVFNQVDHVAPSPALIEELHHRGLSTVSVSARTGEGLDALKQAIADQGGIEPAAPQPILSDLVGAGQMAVLVVPVDKEAPKGRLILPQVQAIRDLLDGRCTCVVTQPPELGAVLDNLKTPPRLVVTDSQAFAEVAAVTPPEIPLTSFSILFSRFKGDLAEQVRGLSVIDRLTPRDRILVAEACSHHPIEEDIGHVKIPKWLRAHTGQPLRFEYTRGRGLPDDIDAYALVIHCGACMWSRKEMQSRIRACRRHDVPITNYGILIAKSLGILDRVIAPFPEIREPA